MAYSYVTYTGNGSQTDYVLPFLYIKTDDITATVGGVSVSFTWINAAAIRISPAPAAAAIVQIRRSTDKVSAPVDFTDGSNLLERDLDLLALWTLYVAQEAIDNAGDSTISVAAAVAAQTAAQAAQIAAQAAAAAFPAYRHSKTFTATAGQTLFTLDFGYTPGAGALNIFVNGIEQHPGSYTETSTTSFTFTEGLTDGDSVYVRTGVDVAQGVLSDNVSFQQVGTGASVRNVKLKLNDVVSVKDFGAIGTAVPANVTADTAAFTAAMATGRNVFVPEGTYYISSTINIGAGQRLCGSGRAKTFIFYTGTGNGIYMGAPGNIQLVYDCELHDLSIMCTNRASTVNGVMVENCVYFRLQSLSIFGSGSPNSGVPADRVLYGNGLYLTNNSIIGHISHVSCRLWDQGYYLKTLAGGQSYWTASLVFDGQGELANNMKGIVVGDPTIGFFTGVSCSFRDLCLQGNYTAGMYLLSGDNTVVDSCYFEGNANYDILVGSQVGAPAPIGCKIINNAMNTEGIGVTPYGNFPYVAKVLVDRGAQITLRDNNMSVSTSIPLIIVSSSATDTKITGNRLNSAIAVTGRISNGSNTTITSDNTPEAPRVFVGSFTRALNAASATVSYTGLGFRPTSLEFMGSVDTVGERTIGYASASSGTQNRCMTTDASGNNTSSNNCIKLIRSTAADYQAAVLATFDADGFTLTWTKTGSPPPNDLTVNYIARR